jgi:hypothetical protein
LLAVARGARCEPKDFPPSAGTARHCLAQGDNVKDPKQKKDKKAKRSGGLVVHDWQPMFAAVKDVIDWALD